MSKFSDLAKARRESKDAPVEMPDTTVVNPIELPVETQPRKGRPKGKRSDPEFEQVTAYIRRETYRNIKIKLLQEGSDREFSELLEDLLTEYLKN